jgi:DNA-binding MarR family transcriptional regulator
MTQRSVQARLRRDESKWLQVPLIEQYLQIGRMLEALIEVHAGKHSMTVTEARVLACARRLGHVGEELPTPSQISAETGYSRPHTTGALQALEQRRWIRREAGIDGRTIGIAVTARGVVRLNLVLDRLLHVEGALRNALRVTAAKSKIMSCLTDQLQADLDVAGKKTRVKGSRIQRTKAVG